jgi:hypothetical protein
MSEGLARASDRELLVAMRAATNDRSWAIWLIVPLATMPAGAIYGEAVALAVLVASVALCVLLFRLRERLPYARAAKQAEREYKRRFRLYELTDYEAEALASLEKPGAPEVILLFSGDGLPEGTHHFVRVDLGDEPRLQIRRALPPQDWLKVEDPEAQLFRYDGPLSDEHISRVRRLLATFTADLLVPPSHFVLEGFPCSAVVLRRGAQPMWTTLNMSNLPAELYQHPSAKLLRMFMELEAEV